jgi:outer membrane protein TolC
MIQPILGHAQEPAPAQAPAQTASATETQLPPSPIEIAQQNGTAVPMSLADVTKLALQNNLEIAIQDTNEELYLQKVTQAYGPYDPVLAIGTGLSGRKSPNTNVATQSTDRNFSTRKEQYYTFRFTQNLPTGGDIRVDFNTNRTATDSSFALINPNFGASALAEFRQPLRRNFRTDQTRTNIKLVNLDLKVNDSQFRQKVTDTIARIQALYWDLVGTIRDYEIRRESVKLAQITLQNNRKKVEIGTLAPIGITEAQAELANREVEMIQSEERINNSENSLRSLISNDRNDPIWQKTIVPTETPEFREFKVTLDEAISVALQNRPELEQLGIQMQKNDLNYNLNANQRKWQVNFVGSFGSVGTSGPQSFQIDPITGQQRLDDNGNPIPRVAPQYVGGLGNAYSVLFGENLLNWAAGLELVIPLGNRNIDSQLAQLKIQKQQLFLNRRVTEQQIQVEIRNAVQALETSKKRVDTAKIARELAQEQLVGEEKRFQAGLSENFRVLDRQRGLSSAQGVELQALIAYKKAIIELQKSIYTLLQSNDFEVAKSNSVSVPDVK